MLAQTRLRRASPRSDCDRSSSRRCWRGTPEFEQTWDKRSVRIRTFDSCVDTLPLCIGRKDCLGFATTTVRAAPCPTVALPLVAVLSRAKGTKGCYACRQTTEKLRTAGRGTLVPLATQKEMDARSRQILAASELDSIV